MSAPQKSRVPRQEPSDAFASSSRILASCRVDSRGSLAPQKSRVPPAGAVGRFRVLLPNPGESSSCFVWGPGPTQNKVPPAGFEPAHMAPEANALSPELRGLIDARAYPEVMNGNNFRPSNVRDLPSTDRTATISGYEERSCSSIP